MPGSVRDPGTPRSIHVTHARPRASTSSPSSSAGSTRRSHDRELQDVGALVAVLRRLTPGRRRPDALGEGAHLVAAIVDVVLARDAVTLRFEQARDRVPEDRVAPAGHGHGSRRVGAHELDVDPLARGRRRSPPAPARLQDLLDHLLKDARVQPQVHEPRPGDLGARDHVAARRAPRRASPRSPAAADPRAWRAPSPRSSRGRRARPSWAARAPTSSPPRRRRRARRGTPSRRAPRRWRREPVQQGSWEATVLSTVRLARYGPGSRRHRPEAPPPIPPARRRTGRGSHGRAPSRPPRAECVRARPRWRHGRRSRPSAPGPSP